MEAWLYEKSIGYHKMPSGINKRDVAYTIDLIKIPKKLYSETEEIKASIKEALLTKGWNYSPEQTGTTKVENLDEARIEYK